ncbi:MAG TPA: hypothetical protein VNB65_04275 [Gaiellaceae bacterium]|jgi:hypothetical protein|nr:hypothetical protein [Gaiellaceae bacterium]
MSSLALARHQWAEGKRQLDAAGFDTARSRHLIVLVEAVAAELARRIGQTFTLAELAQLYVGSEDWVRDVIVASAPARSRAGIRDTALVQDAAFALYAQGASDYRP